MNLLRYSGGKLLQWSIFISTLDFAPELDSSKIQLPLLTPPFGPMEGTSDSKYPRLNSHLFLFQGLLSLGEELLCFSCWPTQKCTVIADTHVSIILHTHTTLWFYFLNTSRMSSCSSILAGITLDQTCSIISPALLQYPGNDLPHVFWLPQNHFPTAANMISAKCKSDPSLPCL